VILDEQVHVWMTSQSKPSLAKGMWSVINDRMIEILYCKSLEWETVCTSYNPENTSQNLGYHV
jgi:hypothetical protein